MRFTEKCSEKIAKISNIIASVALVIMLTLMMIVVIGRYFFNVVPPWSEEMALFMMSWLGFLSASAIEKEKGHIRISVIDTVYPALLLKICNVLRYFIKLVFAFFLTKYGWYLARHAKGYYASVEIPKRFSFYPGFFAGLIICLVLLLRFKAEVIDIWKKDVDRTREVQE